MAPRALVFIYTMRSKRDIAHVGGDVDANTIDFATMVRTADWIICELIRLYHSLSLEDAQDLVDGISVRQLPDIWEINGKKRVLRPGLTAKQQTLSCCTTSRRASSLRRTCAPGWSMAPSPCTGAMCSARCTTCA
jgi:hypothetical protein